MEMEPCSEQISQFLIFLRATDEISRICEVEEQEMNKQTQDILHSIELENHTYNELARMAKKLREIRQRRREAKDKRLSADLVSDWYGDNIQFIKSLERLLGDVRKAEKKIENRIYVNRTSVMEEIE